MQRVNISLLYPYVDLDKPKTGGQIYDARFRDYLKRNNVQITLHNEASLNFPFGKSIFMLPLNLICNLKKLKANKAIIYNTALFPYYIIPFMLLRILHPHVKLFGIHHHFRFQEQKGIKRVIYKFLEFTNLRQCDGVICPCPYTRDIILENDRRVHSISIENSFEPEIRPLSTFKEKYFVFVGSVYQRKGLSYLIKAISFLDEKDREGLRVDIVGNLEAKEYVSELTNLISIMKLENNIRFTGRVEDLSKYYGNAYAFVLPSLLEGYGLVIIEAMRYGLPVIAFNNSAMPYTIKDGFNGLLAIDRDPKSLSSKISQLINNKSLHSHLVQGAIETSNNVRLFEDMEKDVKTFVSDYLG